MALPVANTAKYELMLPSQQKTIKFRPFLVKEEKVLLMAMESGESKEMLSAIKEIVKSCTFGEMIAENYPMFDIEYVFLQIRSKSVGEKTKLKILCPDDGKTYAQTEIDLSKIEVFVDDDHSPNIMIDEDRKLGVVMRYPALKDVDSDTLQGDINIQKTYKMITSCIEQIYEGDQVYFRKDTPEKEIQEFVDNLSADQMKKLSTFYNTMPRLEHKVMVKNPKTEVESEVTLKGLASFFG
tara:strand:- start:131 stop:847 length:717 start_codon:yes stop_codon:yes gene_type:complete